MDQETIDRLFREKLGANEVAPSPKAWSEVERQIGGKRKPTILWIAASITLIVTVSWVVWPQHQASSVEIASQEIDHPILARKASRETPIAASLKQKDSSVQEKAKVGLNKTPPMMANVDVQPIETLDIEEPRTLENQEVLVAKEDEPLPVKEDVLMDVMPDEEVLAPVYKTVKITYIASNKENSIEEPTKSDSTNALKKFIAFTEKIDPGEVLADIKTAKDNLLNGGLKNKKDRTIMTP